MGGTKQKVDLQCNKSRIFLYDIRQQASSINFGRYKSIEVEVEDLSSEENLAGVNPLPVDCPLV